MPVDELTKKTKEPWVWINSPFVGMSPWTFYGLSLFAFALGLFLAAMSLFGFGWSEGNPSVGLSVGFLVFFGAFAAVFLVGGLKKQRWVTAYRDRYGVKPWPVFGRKLWLVPFLLWTTLVFTLWTLWVHGSIDLDDDAWGPRGRGAEFILVNPIPSLVSIAGLIVLVWLFGRKTRNNLQWEKDHNPNYPFL